MYNCRFSQYKNLNSFLEKTGKEFKFFKFPSSKATQSKPTQGSFLRTTGTRCSAQACGTSPAAYWDGVHP